MDAYVLKQNQKRLVQLLNEKGIVQQEVLDAILQVPRHLFIDSALWHLAYKDMVLPIGSNQTISHPSTVAFQTQLLGVKEDDKVLEIGLGSGYQAAILCQMGCKVYSIERNEGLWKKANQVLPQVLSTHMPITKCDDGYKGWAEFAPFDAIVVTAGALEIPENLLKQLKVGGRLIVPVAENEVHTERAISEERHYTMHRITRISVTAYESELVGNFAFVPFLKGTK